MARTHRLSIAALIVCLVGTSWNGTLFAREEERASSATPSSQTSTSMSSEVRMSTSGAFAQASAADDSRPAAMGVSTDSPTVMKPFGVRFKAGDVAANGSMDSIGHSHGLFDVAPVQFATAFAGQVYRGQPRRMRSRRDGSIAAVVIGAVASITGAAILVYANRPECSRRELATGCGYGTKVVGGAVLAGGVVGLTVGALTWR